MVEQFGLSSICADYLISKGITNIDAAERFLYPSPNHLNDPYCFEDMQKAVERIKKAITKREKIFIYADYDCDGICACVILYKILSSKGADVTPFLPDRFSDGYGMNMKRICEIYEAGASLIITVDNGITAAAEIAEAARLGMDVILTDHHIPPEKLPEAYAMINPKIGSYPCKEISGAAVAFKLAQAMGIESPEMKEELLSLAAVACVADLVPLEDENRTIVSLGLNCLKKNPNLGLKELIRLAGLKAESLNSGNISYQIAPRINASGRMSGAESAFDLLSGAKGADVRTLAENLNELNEQRKATEEEMLKKAREYILENDLLEKQKVLFILLSEAHEGVIGITAGKLAETFNRPAVVGSAEGGEVRASARSVAGFDIYEALSAGRDYYIKFGGHEQAAGFTLKEEDFTVLAGKVNEKADAMGIDAALIQRFYYDFEAAASLLTEEAVRQMEAFAPYGIANPHPVFRFSGAMIKSISFMGAGKNHVRCSIVKGGKSFSAVAFNMAREFTNPDMVSKLYDVLFVPSLNTYNGKTRLQLEIKHITPFIECPKAYYESLYARFILEGNEFTPDGAKRSKASAESMMLSPEGKLFVVYGKDMLLRIIRYAQNMGMQTSFSYGTPSDHIPGAVNVLVNPLRPIEADKYSQIVVCDRPCFSGYYSEIMGGCENAVFLGEERYLPGVMIDRDYIAYIYKKLGMLKTLGGDMAMFIDYLNTDSELNVNYFLLRVCFDILSDVCIMDYVISSGKLEVFFHKVEGTKDIYSSGILQKLMRAYE
ncbi:MAG: single-stranded-DNA-specific exonuclease RecJ [Eubacteriaceae bacterium]|nr:single-stranded-DNA-specific exonuclease RecJ [Eubacteriaceae bacterium]